MGLRKTTHYTLLAALLLTIVGCTEGPQWVRPENRQPIDRRFIETPRGYVLTVLARGLTAPTSIAFVNDDGEYKGSLVVAESGVGSFFATPRIYGWKPDGTFFNVYPHRREIPLLGLVSSSNDIYGPIGGMVVYQGRIYITHRDHQGFGVVSALTFDGKVTTVQGGLPAQGDYSLTDITVDPVAGRLYFGVGAATNSGVVGIDNWQIGWVRNYPNFCDRPGQFLKLQGFKFLTKNPMAGLFGGDDNVETAPFQPFGHNNLLSISASPMPTAAIYSVSTQGGDLKLVAHGIRNPRGLAYNPNLPLFLATNDGMELRGTRPIMNDPDALVRVYPVSQTWYGWPDYSTDFRPIDDPNFLDVTLVSRTGYPELAALINHNKSNLPSPADSSSSLLYGKFDPLSGAAKLDFVPSYSSLRTYYQDNVIIALDGDRAPLATSGMPLNKALGRKIMRVDTTRKVAEEFIHNTQEIPAKRLGDSIESLERPNDVKFGPDGNLYILDYGKMGIVDSRERVTPGTGRIYMLVPEQAPTTSK